MLNLDLVEHDFHVNFNYAIFSFLNYFLQGSKNNDVDLIQEPYLMSYALCLQHLVTTGSNYSSDHLCRHKQELLGLLADFRLVNFIVLRFTFD